MPLYELTPDAIRRVKPVTFAEADVRERQDLQRVLRDEIGVVAADVLVIREEFSEWEESRRRIDLLGVDKQANLVVIELKRTDDGGHMELRALRYAAMVSTMTFQKAVDVYGAYLLRVHDREDARQQLLEFLGWDEPDEDALGQDVRTILVSADFSREVTTSVMWLNERGLNIRCVRLRPHDDGGRILLDRHLGRGNACGPYRTLARTDRGRLRERWGIVSHRYSSEPGRVD